MSMASKLIFFTLLLNICAGILSVALTGVADISNQGIKYSDTKNVDQTTWKGDLSTPGTDNTNGFWMLRFLDFISFGIFGKVKALFDNTILGLPNLFKNLGILPAEYVVYFDLVLFLVYIVGVVELFTSKKVTI